MAVRKKWKSAKSCGNEFEAKIMEMLEQSGIPYTQEKTMSEIAKRTAGKVDFILKNPIGYLECKRYTKSITFKLNSQAHDIKWSQIVILSKEKRQGHISGFLLQETTDQNIYYMCIEKFLTVWSNSNKSSMNLKDIQENGQLITNFDWIKK